MDVGIWRPGVSLGVTMAGINFLRDLDALSPALTRPSDAASGGSAWNYPASEIGPVFGTYLDLEGPESWDSLAKFSHQVSSTNWPLLVIVFLCYIVTVFYSLSIATYTKVKAPHDQVNIKSNQQIMKYT